MIENKNKDFDIHNLNIHVRDFTLIKIYFFSSKCTPIYK
jgi:hypothetical protein